MALGPDPARRILTVQSRDPTARSIQLAALPDRSLPRRWRLHRAVAVAYAGSAGPHVPRSASLPPCPLSSPPPDRRDLPSLALPPPRRPGRRRQKEEPAVNVIPVLLLLLLRLGGYRENKEEEESIRGFWCS